jgi:hypothetical protein
MTYEVHVVDLPAQPAMVIRGHVANDEIAALLGQTFGEIMAVLQRQHAQITGAPFGRYQQQATAAGTSRPASPSRTRPSRTAIRS